MQPRHRTFVRVSDVLRLLCLKTYPSRHDIHTVLPISQCDHSLSGFNSQTTTWPFFCCWLKWLSAQNLFINVKASLFFLFFYPFVFFFLIFWWLICSLLFIFILFFFPFLCSLGYFLVVIWFVTALFFIDSEIVFLWFWPENLFFVQVIFLFFFVVIIKHITLYNISPLYILVKGSGQEDKPATISSLTLS
jgi:hypothetical protein